MVISDNFVLMDVADEYMLVPVGETAKSMKGIIAVNEPVFILLKRMAEPKSKEDLVSILTENYDVDVETASRDVSTMIKKLLELGVIGE